MTSLLLQPQEYLSFDLYSDMASGGLDDDLAPAHMQSPEEDDLAAADYLSAGSDASGPSSAGVSPLQTSLTYDSSSPTSSPLHASQPTDKPKRKRARKEPAEEAPSASPPAPALAFQPPPGTQAVYYPVCFVQAPGQPSGAAPPAMQIQPHQLAPAMPALPAPVRASLPPDDDLLRMSSEQIEEYIKACKTSSLLSTTDERRLRKLRRLIKNREYAQQSRNKKKQYLGNVEKDLMGIKEENQRLIEEVAALRTRNQELESENSTLRSLLAQAGLKLPAQPSQQPPAQHQQQVLNAAATPVIANTSSSAQRRAGAAAVCLLAVLLFGIVMGPLFTGSGVFETFRSYGAMQKGSNPTVRTLKSADEALLTSPGHLPSPSLAMEEVPSSCFTSRYAEQSGVAPCGSFEPKADDASTALQSDCATIQEPGAEGFVLPNHTAVPGPADGGR